MLGLLAAAIREHVAVLAHTVMVPYCIVSGGELEHWCVVLVRELFGNVQPLPVVTPPVVALRVRVNGGPVRRAYLRHDRSSVHCSGHANPVVDLAYLTR